MIIILNKETIDAIRNALRIARQDKLLPSVSRGAGISVPALVKISNDKTSDPGYLKLMRIQEWLLDNSDYLCDEAVVSSTKHSQHKENCCS